MAREIILERGKASLVGYRSVTLHCEEKGLEGGIESLL